jgi:hypothetical protein
VVTGFDISKKIINPQGPASLLKDLSLEFVQFFPAWLVVLPDLCPKYFLALEKV